MMITGPYITKYVIVVYGEDQLDTDAYWNLDFDGELLPEGAEPTLLYARIAFPTVAAAQHQFRLETDAHAERSRHKPRPRPRRGGQP